MSDIEPERTHLVYSPPECTECGKSAQSPELWTPCYAAFDTGQKYLPVVRLCPECWKKHCFPKEETK